MTESLILIPARLASVRLPNKPLADICGLPMICHVIDRAREAKAGEPIVATDSPEIEAAVKDHGAMAVMTRRDHQSGSDRIWEALQTADPTRRSKTIINLQGDLPTIAGSDIRACVEPLEDPQVDIATLAGVITREEERDNPNVVKAVGSFIAPNRMRALYFTRARAPHGDGPLYHHIGIYAYRRETLEKFVSLPGSPLEKREKLEQLRALENNMRIDIRLVDSIPLGVDTAEDLETARELLRKPD